MSRNGSGGYSLPVNSWNPAVNGVSATAADWQSLINDVATAIQQSVSADGQTPITGNLAMGGNKLTGLGAGVGTGQSLRFEQLFSQGTLTSIASATTTDIGAQLSNFLQVTGTTTITSFGTNYNGPRFLIFSGALLLTHSATLVLPGAANITTVANDCAIAIPISGGWQVVAYQRASGFPVVTTGFALSGANTDITSLGGLTTPLSIGQGGTGGATANAARANLLQLLPVRQTVLNGPVDTNGLAAFGGSTGSTTVTASGTLTATSANGVAGDRVGSVTNPSWTGLSTNGTMYLYLDIAADGNCTTGSTTLLPTYRWGGADVTTNNQFTFNIQEMVGKVGNGTIATQNYRVFVGEVTVAGGVVTAITWYQLQGRFEANPVAMPAASTAQVYSHRLGGNPDFYNIVSKAKITSAVAGCAVGDVVDLFTSAGGTGTNGSSRNFSAVNRNSATFILDGSAARVRHATNGTDLGVSSANTNLLFSMNRGW